MQFCSQYERLTEPYTLINFNLQLSTIIIKYKSLTKNLKTMKKILNLVALVFILSLSVQAQESKEYGPKAGNFGVGIAANPFFDYIGNFFGKTENNSGPTADLANGYSLFGKYFMSDKTAIRAGISLGYNLETTYFGANEEDKDNVSAFAIGLALGLENRIGTGRVQAFYGPSAGIGYSSSSEAYIYKDGASKGDLIKEQNGATISVALGGFGGVEYFLTKNIAIGTELGMGLNFSSLGKGKDKYQGSKDVETGSKASVIKFGFNNTPAQLAPRGTLYFSIYF
jgi:hypothetical protein